MISMKELSFQHKTEQIDPGKGVSASSQEEKKLGTERCLPKESIVSQKILRSSNCTEKKLPVRLNNNSFSRIRKPFFWRGEEKPSNCFGT